ncbi:acyl carrier protein [Kitasatospora sp. NBC_01287]|uniref:acyl carrier protein n=1 Tax=Kitasatospora sp. NBC_01287 TaxID=2903573 RepID=UPI002259BCF4|nr:acyl carrier protein [Kitasatospora sp. NBC_01287]MCX4745843.1 acyl carrier protein [Kitasatospora sp. NBC_01287]
MSVDTTAPTAGGAATDPAAVSAAGPATEAVVEGVVAVFRRVLESEEVTADSDFFRFGGDSLIATRVLSAIARGHGVELSFEDFLLAPTPEGLAAHIVAAQAVTAQAVATRTMATQSVATQSVATRSVATRSAGAR